MAISPIYNFDNLDIRRKEIIKNKLKTFTFPLHELTMIEFIKLLQLNLNLDTFYTILFQYSSYEEGIYLMLGPQVGINVRETHDIKYYQTLYDHLLEKLDLIME